MTCTLIPLNILVQQNTRLTLYSCKTFYLELKLHTWFRSFRPFYHVLLLFECHNSSSTSRIPLSIRYSTVPLIPSLPPNRQLCIPQPIRQNINTTIAVSKSSSVSIRWLLHYFQTILYQQMAEMSRNFFRMSLEK